ncbi:helix-turn-helix domain-containing protein [Candidatus Cetobacterium colombiensis]|jgi:transcriptional regulator with XRE-family HTH domain|uniref:Helix-turn-helix transcriptional regulator n=1 Tax=Candidatus Cetobacterium colombiensis TaxID=3073100 RepID=A0ABU4W5X9_9FUSO|nr:helix-turn-helix transcriptional regulator [Candidatus Cetobacterium colombiensis]MDX8334922.1 helix-turn-helix transcriptional regulator [Candidatus Cetobacterium colombiensis]
MNIKIKFGKRLKEIRNQKKITQEKLSELANIDRSYISDIERGIKSVSLEKMDQLAKALEVNIIEFFKF